MIQSQESKIVPMLRMTFRCMAHGGQKVLENSMTKVTTVQQLLEKVVTMSSSDSSPGSLARALKWGKMSALFRKSQLEEMQQLVSITGKLTGNSTNYAAHRWDSMLTACRIICMNISPILRMLCAVAAGEKESGSDWALDMLKAGLCLPVFSNAGYYAVFGIVGSWQVFTIDNILLLGLITEFLSATESYVHGWDNRGGTRGSSGQNKSGGQSQNIVRRIVSTSERISIIHARLKQLFDFEPENKVPLVMDPRFSKGFCQIMLKQLEMTPGTLLLTD